MITQGQPTTIKLTAVRGGSLITDWVDADTITVSIGIQFGTYDIVKEKADLSIIDDELYLVLSAADTASLLLYQSYGISLVATWGLDDINQWFEEQFTVVGSTAVAGTIEPVYMYPTYEWAEQYFNLVRLISDAWDDASVNERIKSLTQATSIIDRLDYKGTRLNESQPLEFPRTGQDVVPDSILAACCEIAYNLLDGIDPDIEFQNLYQISQGYSTVRSSYDRSQPNHSVSSGVTSVTAWRLLFPYLKDHEQIDLVRV